MARTVDPLVGERNARIVKDFEGNKGQSYDELARRHSVDKSTLYLVLRAAKVINRDDRKPRRGPTELPVLGNTLVMLGLTLEKRVHDKYLEKDVDPDWSPGVAARVIGLKSAQYLTLIFKGQANLSYLEMASIAKFLGYNSVAALLTEIEERVCKNLHGKLGSTG